jgi:hypothetical protein
MFATIKRVARPWRAWGIALAAVTLTAFVPVDARAGFVVKTFSCTTNPLGVAVDVSGLGNTNLCIEGSVTLDLDCACAGGGGNCTSDAKKQTLATTVSSSESVEPTNGRVRETFPLSTSPGDSLCAALDCPSGQTEKLVEFASDDGATFTICTTTEAAGGDCSCDGAPTQGGLPQTLTCGSISGTPFSGKHNSCSNLF